jgi:hypothetical protein
MAHKQELSASADENLTPACACSRKMQIYRGEKVFILALFTGVSVAREKQ